MLCPICNQREGEWQCQVCRRVVCAQDARPTREGVFCIEHAPASTSQQSAQPKPESETLKSIKTAFFTLLFLTAGLGAIVYIGTSSLGGVEAPEIKSAIDMLKNLGFTIIAFLGFLTAVLGLAWISMRSR